MLLANLFLIFFGIMSCGLTQAYSNAGGGVELFKGFKVSKLTLIFLIAFGIGGTIIFLWLIYFYYLWRYRFESYR